MHFLRQFKDHNPGREHENQTNDPIFSSNFSAPNACNIHFCIWKYSKFIFMWSFSFWSKGQLIILFQKVDPLRLLKIYIKFCPPADTKYRFYQAPARGLFVFQKVVDPSIHYSLKNFLQVRFIVLFLQIIIFF